MEIKGRYLLYGIVILSISILLYRYMPWNLIWTKLSILYTGGDLDIGYWVSLLVRIFISIIIISLFSSTDTGFIIYLIFITIIIPEIVILTVGIIWLHYLIFKIIIPWFDKHLTFKI